MPGEEPEGDAGLEPEDSRSSGKDGAPAGRFGRTAEVLGSAVGEPPNECDDSVGPEPGLTAGVPASVRVDGVELSFERPALVPGVTLVPGLGLELEPTAGLEPGVVVAPVRAIVLVPEVVLGLGLAPGLVPIGFAGTVEALLLAACESTFCAAASVAAFVAAAATSLA